MKIRITTSGDESVGIWGDDITMDWNRVIGDEQDRKELREELHQHFSEICDGSTEVWFDDECPDCLSILNKEGECENKRCISCRICE